MKVSEFADALNSNFYTGVPDSQLKEFCDFLMLKFGIGKNHIIAANEGNCVGIAAGHYLATGEIPVVYMQNSGLGNIINPVTSLLHPKVYGIPCIFVIGWRGEPGVSDEPQHKFQGEITLKLLESLDIHYYVVDAETKPDEVKGIIKKFNENKSSGKSMAFVVRKNAFEKSESITYKNSNILKREEVIEKIVKTAGEDVIVCTTGKASRELFEIRERNDECHGRDFLTVGSMGHSSSIALGIALAEEDRKVWCIDGDGAMLMHMGAMAVTGANLPGNMIHVVINNGAHETVGGMPTVAANTDLQLVAKGCGYQYVACADNFNNLETVLNNAKNMEKLCFVEVKCAIGARPDLGRPTTSPVDNMKKFMEYIIG